ncbi:MAG: hypothetical protein WD402_08640 [Chloroflexota bacterium]
MNRDDDFNRTLQAWLRREAPPQAPDRVLETALQRVSTESQRRSWQQRLIGETPMATLLRAAALTAVIVIAVLASLQLNNLIPDVGDSSPSPSITAPSPSATPPAGCINPPTDITTLIDMVPTGPLDPGSDPVACYGDAPLTFDATWYGGGVADCPSAPEPAWLACSAFSLQAAGDTRKVGAPGLFVAIHPSASLSIPSGPYAQVRVTGHFDDPAAQTCRETQLGGGATSLAPAAEMIERCRRTFVVTDVVPLIAGVPDVLAPNAFARVVPASVNVREQAGLDSPNVGIPIADGDPMPAVVGTATGSEHVYILEGPVEADGFEWYRVAPIDYESYTGIGPYFIGWMASGDGTDPWLIVENPCPEGPMTLTDLTYTSTTTDWATRLGCFRGQELTVSGWYPELPPDFETSGPCAADPAVAYFFCNYAANDIRPIEMAFYDERNGNRLDFVVIPGSGIVMPSRGQWIEISGHWDDPTSALCPTGGDVGALSCRIQFVIRSVRALGASG